MRRNWTAPAQPVPTWTAPTSPAIPAGMEMERKEPTRPADLIADLLVPIGQAGVTGGLLASAATFAALQFDLVARADALSLWVGLTLGIAAVAWLILLKATRALLYVIETLTGLDLDGDGAKGSPKRTLEVRVKEGGHERIIGAEWLGMDDDELVLFAAGVARGRKLTEGEWAKDTAAFPQGINEFRRIRGKLLDAGMIERIKPAVENSSCRPTAAGQAFFSRLAECSHTHTHEQGG